MKLLCLQECFIKRLYQADEAYTVSEALAKELLKYEYFRELDGPPPEKFEEPQVPGKRRKISVQ